NASSGPDAWPDRQALTIWLHSGFSWSSTRARAAPPMTESPAGGYPPEGVPQGDGAGLGVLELGERWAQGLIERRRDEHDGQVTRLYPTHKAIAHRTARRPPGASGWRGAWLSSRTPSGNAGLAWEPTRSATRRSCMPAMTSLCWCSSIGCGKSGPPSCQATEITPDREVLISLHPAARAARSPAPR